MPKSARIPGVVHHKPSGRDVVFLRQPDGRRTPVYLGDHGSAEAARRYREVLAEYLAGRKVKPRSQAAVPATEWPTVGQLVAEFLLHVERHYVGDDGAPTRTLVHMKHAMWPLLHMYRDTPTDRFGIRALGTVRQLIVDTEFAQQKDPATNEAVEGTGRRRCRSYVNELVARIKQAFRWGVEQKMVPGTAWHELSALRGLPIGRAGVRESKPVEAIPRAAVDAVLPMLPPTLQKAIELQWWTGMRPSEVLMLRMGDIDRSGDDWVYRPPQHKGRWRGHERAVVFGPQARRVVESLAKADPQAFLISPIDVMQERKRAWREQRESSVPPSQRAREMRNAEKEPPVGEHYDVSGYRRAIHRACDDAGVERWSPHRLRHAAGTRLALEVNIEAAAAVLGHADVRVTRRYALAARSLMAAAVMRSHG